jgi:hypothetical protein
MAELIVLVTRSRKTRVWVCIECLLGAEALDHPSIRMNQRAVEIQDERRQEVHDRQKAAIGASRFERAETESKENDFRADDTPEAKAVEPRSSSFVPASTLSQRLGIPKDGVKKLVKRMEIDVIEHEGVPSVKRDAFEAMEAEVRKIVAKKRKGSAEQKYADQIEHEKTSG